MEFSHETRDAINAITRKVIRAFREAFRRFCKWIQENWQWLKANAVKWYQLEEEKKTNVRQRHKRDFTRRKLSHQVIDRRPHLVRKIIR
ncbi:hypothetical protein [Sporosarcina cyprini]|uniref:hypothetical protein n=1 Tax=Sporosarcina cyprini TaxID=2910523 RepID=UPI001EDD8EC0|nr:hypothetical protein [Sporosarcina cyprini]MCG3089150.1 hypothetical protein [Sporosarcina cyprini]